MFFSPLSIAEGKIRVSTPGQLARRRPDHQGRAEGAGREISGRQLPLSGQHIAHRGPTGPGKEFSF